MELFASQIPTIRLSLLSVLNALLVFLVDLSLADNSSQPISIFRSRPDLEAPVLTLFNHVPEKLAPGYFFIAPYQQAQESVYIFDNDANLIYSGFGSAGPGMCHNPQTCMYKGEVHLCFYQGTQMVGWGHGHGVIMDKHYRVVKSVEPAGTYQASSDMHEFMLINDGKSALMTQYLRSVYDLCDYGLCDGLGYIQQGAFQEIDVETGEVIFEWESLNHVTEDESYVPPGSTEISGSGEQPYSPWDYFHINSIDKSENGDYLVSARHTSAIYRISGKDGHVVWRLGGAKSDYHLDDFSFSSQHDARWISDHKDESIISIFDNGSNGYNQTQPHSTGLVVKLNHKTKTATAVRIIDPPNVNGMYHTSKSQGSYQTLPNGNVIMGWGSDAFWTEYTPTGEVVFYGNIGWTNVMNYRVHKFDDWVGIPLTKPAIWTYSKYGYENSSNANAMHCYVSWNGHTEIKSWRIFTSSAPDGGFQQIDNVLKNGFETIIRVPNTKQYTYAQAIDENGHILGTTSIQTTFVPRPTMHDYCDDLACKFMPDAEARERERQRKEEEEQRLQQQEQERVDAEIAANAKAVEAVAKKRRIVLYSISFAFLSAVLLVVSFFAFRSYITTSRIFRKSMLMVANWVGVGHGKIKGSQSEAEYKVLESQGEDGVRLLVNDGRFRDRRDGDLNVDADGGDGFVIGE